MQNSAYRKLLNLKLLATFFMFQKGFKGVGNAKILFKGDKEKL